MQHIEGQGDAGSTETQTIAPGPTELGIRFVGSGSEYFRIWIVNLLLTLVTVGLYYPFAKTRRLKYFYGATEVGGYPLSFHGQPWAMFRGYVFAAVFFAASSIADWVSPMVGLIAFVALMLVWPALWHLSLRFRLANTGWRGLRLRFTGTRARAYRAFALMSILVAAWITLLTVYGMFPKAFNGRAGLYVLLAHLLGLGLVPMALYLQRRYQQGHLAVAHEQTAFDVRVGKFYRLSGMAMLYAVLIFLAGMLAIFVVGWLGGLSIPWVMAAVLIAVYLVMLCVVGGYFTARLQNLVWNGTRSPGLAFRSTLSAIALIKLWFKNWLLTLVTVGFYHPYAKVASARLRLEAVTLLATVNVDELVAAQEANATTATGDAAGDLFGLDLGL